VKFLLTFLFLFIQTAQAMPEREKHCQELLDWIYKDLTLQNLDQSIERTKTKIMMSMLSSLQHVNQNLKNHPEMAILWKSIAELDPSFEEQLKNNSSFRQYIFWRKNEWKQTKSLNFFEAVNALSELQKKSPELFKMDQKYHLDKWDLMTANMVDHIDEISFQHQEQKDKILALSKELKDFVDSPSQKFKTQADLTALKEDLDNVHAGIYKKMQTLYPKYLEDYQYGCRHEELKSLDALKLSHYLCLAPAEEALPDINPLLKELTTVMTLKSFNSLTAPTIVLPPVVAPPRPRDIIDNLEIKKLNYPVNKNKNATHCLRDMSLVDSLIIHHTATTNKMTPEGINRDHINNSTRNDQWYMIGYNYLVSTTQHGGSASSPSIIQGRPPEMAGAHAGGFTKELDEKQIENLKTQKINCGNENEMIEDTADSILQPDNTINANFTSLGIAVIDNFEARYTVNAGGVVVFRNVQGGVKPKHPSDSVLREVAKLACKIQRDYPNVKKIYPHSYFRATVCPGTLIAYLNKIVEYANQYNGCHYNQAELKK
jgi:hypothetical protein